MLDLPATASRQEIRDAYRLLVKVWHPDRFVGDPEVQRAAAEKLKAVNTAYALLRQAADRRPATPPVKRPASPAQRPPAVSPDPPFVTLEVEAARTGPLHARWVHGVPHPNLMGDGPRVALAGLLVGRALAELAGPERAALLLLSEDAGRALEAGGGPESLARLSLAASTGEALWPRHVSPGPAGRPAAVSTWQSGLHGVLTPRLVAASPERALSGEWWAVPALVAVALLAGELSRPDKRVLGRVVRTVGEFFAAPSDRFEAGCESHALLRALPLLHPLR